MNYFRDFPEGVPPVEADPGESQGSGRRISRSAVFDMVQLSVQVNVQTA